MAKSENESFLDYKKRAIDSVSPTFCAAKWLNATLWLNRGRTASCHHPPSHKSDPRALIENPSSLHNTSEKKRARAEMLAGKRPKECDYCWKVEDIGRNSVSDRVFKTLVHSDEEIRSIANRSPNDDINPRTLEIAFDRQCNFACSYCNSEFSSRWAQDIMKNGPYRLVSKGSETFKTAGPKDDLSGRENPYEDAFWRWWPALSSSLRELRITGGEPLLSKSCWRMLESFKGGRLDHIHLAINSNLGANDETIDRLIEASHSIRHFELYTSNEAFGAQAEYIRDGLDYNRWRANVKRLMTKGRFARIHVMMTVNALSLFSITDLFDDILSWRTEMGLDIGHWTLNLMRFPSFLNVLVLPAHLKAERALHIRAWLDENLANPKRRSWILDMEIAGVRRLIDYLECVETPHDRVSSLERRQSDFVSFFRQYDRRRSKSLRDVFPAELWDWMETVKVIEPTFNRLPFAQFLPGF